MASTTRVDMVDPELLTLVVEDCEAGRSLPLDADWEDWEDEVESSFYIQISADKPKKYMICNLP
jgi:hypothetical protein